MIDCKETHVPMKVSIKDAGEGKVRMLVTQIQPAGHIPKKIAELVMVKSDLIAELKLTDIVE